LNSSKSSRKNGKERLRETDVISYLNGKKEEECWATLTFLVQSVYLFAKAKNVRSRADVKERQ
jgi:hypothetical protein